MIETTPLATKLIEYIEGSKGWFTLDEIYRHLGLQGDAHDKDRTNVRVQLHRYADPANCLIERHKKVNGRYRRVDVNEPEVVDFASVDPNKTVELYLPFNLEDFVDVFETNVFVFAGVTNQFKTEMMIHTAYLNQHHSAVFLNTEMDAVELYRRISRYQPWDAWRNIKFPKRVMSEDIPSLIEHYYKDDFVYIDYLMPADRDEGYMGISRDITRIGNAMRKGNVFIGLQKNKGKEFGRGGEPTLDLPRLYINLDPGPIDVDHSSKFSFGTTEMKIMKCKNPKDSKYNPNGWKFIFRNTAGKTEMPMYKFLYQPPEYIEYQKKNLPTQIDIEF